MKGCLKIISSNSAKIVERFTLYGFRQPRPAGYGRNASRHLEFGIYNHAITDHRPQFHQVAASGVCGLHRNRGFRDFAHIARVLKVLEHLVRIHSSKSG
jgi:hypothetical protein